MTDELTDEELLCAYFRGEAAAFEEFFERHGGRVLGYLSKKGMKPEDAKDVAQDIFLKLHRSIHSYRQGSPAMPWFFTIVHNSFLDWARRNVRLNSREVLVSEVKETSPSSSSEQEHSLTELDLKGLSNDQREVLDLRATSGKSFREISIQIQKSEQAVRKIYERAVDKVRNNVERKGDASEE